MPLGPIEGPEQLPTLPPSRSRDAGEPLVIDPGVPSEPIPPHHGPFPLTIERGCQRGGQGPGGSLGPFRQERP